MTFPFGEPITLLANGATTPDEYGDPIPSQTSTVVLGAFDPELALPPDWVAE